MAKTKQISDEEDVPALPELLNQLKTKEGFDRFLEAAEQLEERGVAEQPQRDGRIIEEVMNFRYTF